MQYSASVLAGLSLGAIKTSQVAAQTQPQGLVDTQLRNIPALPLKPDGSAPEYTPQEAGTITGVLWRTKNQTPEIEFDYKKMKIKLDARRQAPARCPSPTSEAAAALRDASVRRPAPRGTLKWTGVRFSDFARWSGCRPLHLTPGSLAHGFTCRDIQRRDGVAAATRQRCRRALDR
jgi:hypothetical protein